MADEFVNDQDATNEKANNVKEGSKIEVKKGQWKGRKGEVFIVRDNSVLVDLGIDSETNEPIRTVVNHRNYKVIKE
ncbi:DUF2187 family protein [Priestia koreensis]|uniref:DUF2187 domain-containing protein n=2 Tax=Priestia koreensis TaxID=284581 RepID=A0A0M0KX10_9BACI|nr:hypothetical protein AMD01_17440 [Priestia koreensis]